MRFSSVLVVISLAASVGCEPPTESGSVFIEVQTDWIAGEEMRSVRVTVAPQSRPSDIVAAEARDTVGGTAEEEAFRTGLRVAEVGPLSHGPYQAVIELRDPSGEVFANRVIRFQLAQQALGIRAILTRSCREVTCPGGGAPELTECFGGRCVDPRCRPGSLEHCPVVACEGASECGPTATCASPSCESGACLHFGDSGECGGGDICDPEEGCRAPRPPMPDAGMDTAVADTAVADTAMPWDPNTDPALLVRLPMNETGSLDGTNLNAASATPEVRCSGARCPSTGAMGARGAAFGFDGTNDVLTIAHDPTLVTTSGFTLALWVRIEAIPISRTMILMAKPFGGTFRNSWELGFSDTDSDGEGELSFVVDSTVGEATADAEHGLSAGDWAHVAAVWEPAGERLLLYLDGRMAAISAESVAPSFDSSDALVGADDNGAIENHLDGDLDDVRIYARELTVDEIAVLAAP